MALERISSGAFLAATAIALVLFGFIVATLVGKSRLVFERYFLIDLLWRDEWNPGRDLFGILPAIVGTLYVTLIALAIAVPISVLASLYIAEHTRGRTKSFLSSFVDVLAAVPSVVYGLVGLLVVVPFVRDHLAPAFGAESTGLGLLTAGLVLAIMVFPIIISLSTESLHALPVELRESALSLGDTQWGVAKRVLLRGAGPGIVAAVLLGFGRAFGETIAIAMLVGGKMQVPDSPFDAGDTLPSVMVNTFGELMSVPLTQSALIFIALVLLTVVTAFNVLAMLVRNRLERRWRY